ncbi:MAG TPA: hypothetical protein VE175_05090, partial [Woeseiaceae bacterium]|nr:hypothetical protein [Woeseiaceae bacterium]
RQRISAFMTITNRVAMDDPQRALAMLDELERADERQAVRQNIAFTWLQRDPEGALEWMLAADRSERGDFIQMAGQTLMQTDLDAAMRVLSRLDKKNATMWAGQIASHLGMERSVAEAEAFIAQYEGGPDYDEMLMAVISGVAQTDAEAAVGMMARLPDGGKRQMLYQAVYSQYAEQYPRRAADSALTTIEDDSRRSQVLGAIAARWSYSDPQAAAQWVRRLPHGSVRDAAVVGLTAGWRELTAARRQMIEEIGNAEQRKQAFASVLYRVARDDPEQAQRLLADIDLPDDDKEAIRQSLQQIQEHSGQASLSVY